MSTEAATQPEAHLRALGANAEHTKRNHRLGMAAAVFAGFAQDFLQPEVILGGMIYALTDSVTLAAMVPLLNKAGSLAPPFLVSGLFEHHPRRRPAYLAVATVRVVALAALVGTMILLAHGVTTARLIAFFATYFVASMCAGTVFVIFMDMTGRLIPPDRVGSFLGMRGLIGGTLSIAGGFLIIQPILTAVTLPWNYVLLAVIGVALVVIDHGLWGMTREHPGPKADRRTSLADMLRRGFRWLREDHDYRCYLLVRIAFRINYLVMVFTIPYGKRLGFASGAESFAILGGILVASRKLSAVVSSPLWGRFVDRFGSRKTLIGAGLCLTAGPLLALAAPMLPRVFEIPVPGAERGVDLPVSVFILSLVFMQAGFRASMLGGHRFLINHAPAHRRSSYMAFLNAITSPLALLPLAAAGVAETIGIGWVFAGAVGGGLLALIGGIRMNRQT